MMRRYSNRQKKKDVVLANNLQKKLEKVMTLPDAGEKYLELQKLGEQSQKRYMELDRYFGKEPLLGSQVAVAGIFGSPVIGGVVLGSAAIALLGPFGVAIALLGGAAGVVGGGYGGFKLGIVAAPKLGGKIDDSIGKRRAKQFNKVKPEVMDKLDLVHAVSCFELKKLREEAPVEDFMKSAHIKTIMQGNDTALTSRLTAAFNAAQSAKPAEADKPVAPSKDGVNPEPK